MFHRTAKQVADAAEEVRLRAFVEGQAAFSETAVSLAVKLQVNARTARRVLDGYVKVHEVQRRTFEPRIEPVYYRYTPRAG